ncbi:hypothetical protein SLEP1_g18267 [Rubroshorea leprosula]|uniref:Uncharacterized protein n=1 Tax=Rubroshorea leprosula TaxID=152421 RepID=A0AAV5IWW7_9ROSI|nr:hypothetical protein SLEP1_g18267 [Rubroshorea leprosula]
MFQPIIWHALYLMSGPHVYLLRYFISRFPCPPFQVVRPDAWEARESDELDG